MTHADLPLSPWNAAKIAVVSREITVTPKLCKAKNQILVHGVTVLPSKKKEGHCWPRFCTLRQWPHMDLADDAVSEAV